MSYWVVVSLSASGHRYISGVSYKKQFRNIFNCSFFGLFFWGGGLTLARINIIYQIYNLGKMYYFGDTVKNIFKSCEMFYSVRVLCVLTGCQMDCHFRNKTK